MALSRVCRVLEAPRSTVYARRGNVTGINRVKPGPETELSDDELTDLIRQVLGSSPFTGEGYRKVTAHLRRDYGCRVGRKRVLRLMRLHGLLAPQRGKRRRKARAHDGTIIPAAPDIMWGTDATMSFTRDDGWVWVFACVEHFTAEAWASVAKRGDRFPASSRSTTPYALTSEPSTKTSLAAWPCVTTGDPNTPRHTSKGPCSGWASPTHRPSPASRHATAAPNGSSAHSKNRSSGPSSTTTSTSCDQPSPCSSNATTASGSSSATATGRHARRTRPHEGWWPRENQAL